MRQVLNLFNSGSDVITSVAFSGDGKTLVTADIEGIARIWDVATGRQVGQFGDAHSRIGSVAISPDGKTLATVGLDNTVRSWDMATRHQVGPAPIGKAGAFPSVILSPDGSMMAFADGGGTVRLWNVATGQQKGQPLATLAAQGQPVVFSPDGRTLAIAGIDGMVRLWDVTTGREIKQFVGDKLAVTSVEFGPGGRTLVTGASAGQRGCGCGHRARDRPTIDRLHRRDPVGGVQSRRQNLGRRQRRRTAGAVGCGHRTPSRPTTRQRHRAGVRVDVQP
ncbi:MAG TPA: hypothetical protein VGL06_30865 [Pseudonocardiaceae bacterium]